MIREYFGERPREAERASTRVDCDGCVLRAFAPVGACCSTPHWPSRGDHGDTSCKTQSAESYILKSAARHAKPGAGKASIRKTSIGKTQGRQVPSEKLPSRKAVSQRAKRTRGKAHGVTRSAH